MRSIIKPSMRPKFLVLNFLYFIIRPPIVRFIDPLTKVKIGRHKILFPLSHNFPLFIKLFPDYSQNVGRLAKIALKKYPQLKLVDIGANIGDTVAILRRYANFPILCIEGNPHYFKLLKRNMLGFEDIELAQEYLGISNKVIKAEIVTTGGSAHISGKSRLDSIETKTLEEVLKTKKGFANSKFVKIDTDGYDTLIIKGAVNWLEKVKPIIFFEYSPDLLSRNDEYRLEVFNLLRRIGYEHAAFYNNFGEYLLSTKLDNKELIEDITTYFSGKENKEYCDVCVFHKNDRDLFKIVRNSELKHFKNLKAKIKIR